jgi:peroxiredoxin
MRLKHLVIAVFALALAGSLVLFRLAPTGVRKAPDISVTTLQGKQLSMASLRGHPVLVNFWATTCPGCLSELPRLAELYTEFAPRGLEIIGVSMAYDPPDRVIALSEARRIPYPLALDINSRTAAAFGDVSVTPSSFLIAPDGRVLEQRTGELDMDKMRDLLAGMLGDGSRVN